MEQQEPVKGTYQHYKGGLYEVLGIAEDPTREGRWVVYQSLGITEDLTGEQDKKVLRTGNKGALSICSVERFTEPVTDKDHTHGKPVPRFKLVNRLPRD
jgi:hypothetical protein